MVTPKLFDEYGYYYLKYLALEAEQLRQACRPESTLTLLQATLRHMFSDWAHVPRSTGRCEQHEDNLKEYQ